MTTKKNEVAKQNKGEISTPSNDLDLLKSLSGAGQENMDVNSYKVPRLSVVQALSDVLKKDSPSFVEGCEVGCLYENVTNTFWSGQEGLIAVPVHHNGKWINSAGNEIVETWNYFLVIFDEKTEDSMDIVFSFKKSTIAMAKGWNTMMRTIKVAGHDGKSFNPPTFYQAYRMATAVKTKDGDSWMVPKITSVSPANEVKQGLFEQAYAFYQMVGSTDIQVEGGEEGSSKPSDEEIPM